MTSSFPSNPSQLYAGGINDDLDSPSNSLLYSLSILKEKVHQVESLLSLLISPGPNQSQPPESTTIAMASMGTLIQEIIVTASSMMFTCQNMDMGSSLPSQNCTDELQNSHVKPSEERGQAFYSGEIHDWYRGSYSSSFNMRDYYGQGNQAVSQRKTLSEPILLESEINVPGKINEAGKRDLPRRGEKHDGSSTNYDIIELDAADLLAKYTHYCHVCGKGFKRDANLRMHMRAHGDEYKSRAALSNPMKNISDQDESSKDGSMNLRKKYSCPQEGCRWNRKHAKFQPLKSMICVKNHYKRSHCPKMYVCKRCNRKQFSVLSDLRTHEKHCGDLKWQCSCGTTFSRKDKLMGHVALFVGHHPAATTMTMTKKTRNVEQHVQVLLM